MGKVGTMQIGLKQNYYSYEKKRTNNLYMLRIAVSTMHSRLEETKLVFRVYTASQQGKL